MAKKTSKTKAKAKAAVPAPVKAFNDVVVPAVLAYCGAVDSNRSEAQTFAGTMRDALIAMYDAAKDAAEFLLFITLTFGDTTKGKAKTDAQIGSIRAALPESHRTLGPVRTAISQARRVALAMAKDAKQAKALKDGTLRGTHDAIAKAEKDAAAKKAGKADSSAKLPGSVETVTCAQMIATFGIETVLQEVAKILITDTKTKLDGAACAAIATKLRAA